MDGSEKPRAMGEVIQIDESRIGADLGEMCAARSKRR